MADQDSGTRPKLATSAHDAQRSLLLQAAGVLRLRYVRCGQDTSLSPTAADGLANVFEGVAKGYPALDKIDRKEAIALAHRLIDDDHPELSRLWPRTG